MTPDDFRRLALQFHGAIESAHMDHPDFRVGKRIFATLDYPEPGWAMVRLLPEQQEKLISTDARVFSRAAGGWGEKGSTLLQLAHTDEETAESALRMAYENLERRFSLRS
jgi:hypothetical protein